MKNKILIGIIILFAVLLVMQSLYIARLQQRYARLPGIILSRVQARIMEPRLSYSPGSSGVNSWDPFEEFDRMPRRINMMLQDARRRQEAMPHPEYKGGKKCSKCSESSTERVSSYKGFEPAIDLKDTPADYLIKVDLPGMKKEDIKVEVKDNYLMISGERKQEAETQKEGLYKQERSFGYFLRKVLLPENIKPKEVSSDYKNGILTVKIPKAFQKK